MKLLLWIDVQIGHRWIFCGDLPIPDWFIGWWYDHICQPAGAWECRE